MSYFQFPLLIKQFHDWINLVKKQLRPVFNVIEKNKKPPVFKGSIFLNALTQLFIYWFLSGFFIVQSPFEAIITRLGNYQRTANSGIHWHFRFLEKVYKVSVEKPQHYHYTLTALTADANLARATVKIEYRITDSRLFMFSMNNTREYFAKRVAGSLQAAIHRFDLTNIFSDETRILLQKEIQKELKQEIAHRNIGLTVSTVELSELSLPTELKKEFNNLQKIQAESKELMLKAKQKAKQLEHETELKIQALYADADIQKNEMIYQAQTETVRFLTLLPYYEKNPALTLQRLQVKQVEKISKYPGKILLIRPKKFLEENALPIQLVLDKTFLEVKTNSTEKKEASYAK